MNLMTDNEAPQYKVVTNSIRPPAAARMSNGVATPAMRSKAKVQNAPDASSDRRASAASVHGEGFRRHVALPIDVPVKGLPGQLAIDNLDAADFDQSVGTQRVKDGGFGIEKAFRACLSGRGAALSGEICLARRLCDLVMEQYTVHHLRKLLALESSAHLDWQGMRPSRCNRRG